MTNVPKDTAGVFFIENAGAIIIAPFLPALFKKLKIIAGSKISDFQTAVLMLQYAVSGDSKLEEYDLPLPKILCGLDTEFVIDANIELTAEQKNEVNEMLSSLIDQWTVMKHTSIAGLQESFLKRRGKITVKKNEWLLQIEHNSSDLLLDQLPWNINIIKLPWMEEILRADWI